MEAIVTTSQPFRLLELLLELREQIYHYSLCIFSSYVSSPNFAQSFEQYASAIPYRRRFLGNTNLLLANRLIYSEAQLYMLKTNLLVRVQNYACDVITSFGSDPLPVVHMSTTVPNYPCGAPAASRSKTFPGYVFGHQISTFLAHCGQSTSTIWIVRHAFS